MDGLTDGYVTDLGYTYGYYPQLNPLRAQLALTLAGVQTPPIAHACELGFGQGVSLAVHAAASAVSWVGTDIVPEHVAFAQRLATASGVGARLAIRDEGFDTFCRRTDLPDFDYIALHGVWSWISEDHRSTIVDFIGRKLKPGGLLYVSYNALPGGFATAALRELLITHSEPDTERSGTAERVAGAMSFLQQLFDEGPTLDQTAAAVKKAFAQLPALGPAYVAHEYFNQNQTPMFFRQVYERLGPIGLAHVSSAQHFGSDLLALPSHHRATLAGIRDPVFFETVKDYLLNRRFRQEYWVRGPKRMSPTERDAALRDTRIVLTRPVGTVKKQMRWLLNAARLPKELYNGIRAALADQAPRSIGLLAEDERVAPFGFERLIQALMFMAEDNVIGLAQAPEGAARAHAACARLNAHLLASDERLQVLASPVVGGGIPITNTQREILRGSRSDLQAQHADHSFFKAMLLA